MKRRRHIPLHISPFCSPQGKDTILGEDVQTKRIDTFLVDDHEVLRLFVGTHGLIAYQILELDDLFTLCIREASFGFNELFTLFC